MCNASKTAAFWQRNALSRGNVVNGRIGEFMTEKAISFSQSRGCKTYESVIGKTVTPVSE